MTIDTTDRYVLVNGERFDAAIMLWALYRNTHPVGLGIMSNKNDFSIEDARQVLDQKGDTGFNFDYVYGRPIKVLLEWDEEARCRPAYGAEIDRPDLFDRDAGPGAFDRAVETARKAMLADDFEATLSRKDDQ